MFERFTDRARKVMALANQEAQRFNHEYIGTEHVLLAIIKEGSGVGATALKDCDISLRKIRIEVERLVKSGSDVVTMGKLPYTPRVKTLFDNAIVAARDQNHNYIGTEHLLLGLLMDPDSLATQVLTNLGVTAKIIREDVLRLLGAPDSLENEHPDHALRQIMLPQHLDDLLVKIARDSGETVNKIICDLLHDALEE